MKLLSYFRTESEGLHYAIEVAPRSWRALNANEPVLRGEVGSLTLRDPFLFQDRVGRFHLLATDSWQSAAIVHATSPDLIAWSPQRLLQPMAAMPLARNAWAPECFWEAQHQAYRILWSSTIGGDLSRGMDNHRIWSVLTPDFIELSPPEIYFDPGYPVIDANVALQPEGAYMIFKDERGSYGDTPDFRTLRTAFRPAGSATWERISEPIAPHCVEGPILLPARTEWIVYYDHFFADKWGASVSEDFVHWTPVEISMPFRPRHGSIIEVEKNAPCISHYGF